MVQEECTATGITQEKQGLGAKVDKITEFINKKEIEEKEILEKKGKKKYKKILSRKVTMGSKNKLKKNYCLVLHVMINGGVNTEMLPIENEFVRLPNNLTYHVASSEYMLTWHKPRMPCLIIFEGSLYPLKLSEYERMVKEQGISANPQKVILNAMELADLQLKGKSRMDGKMMFLLIIGGIIAVYFVTTMMKGGTP